MLIVKKVHVLFLLDVFKLIILFFPLFFFGYQYCVIETEWTVLATSLK